MNVVALFALKLGAYHASWYMAAEWSYANSRIAMNSSRGACKQFNLRRMQWSRTYFLQQEDNALDMHEVDDTYAAQQCIEVCFGGVVQYCSVKSVVDKCFVIPATTSNSKIKRNKIESQSSLEDSRGVLWAERSDFSSQSIRR